MTPRSVDAVDFFRTPETSQRKKRLGQFLTGSGLAALLARLASAEDAASAIDPMAGDGNMLEAVARLAPSAELFGIELDAKLAASARLRLGKRARIVAGDAFAWDNIAGLSRSAFDLVITNPPYVRYQSLVDSGDDLPHANAVRAGLSDIVWRLPSLSESDRRIFAALARSYSGLSDLAIPAWILCAMLVKPGGTLAMVAPESWLTRDYADCIHYLLLKLFRLRWVIENETRDWFEDALVKTTLVVARRTIDPHDLSTLPSDEAFIRVVLRRQARDNRSPAGGLFPDQEDPDSTLHDLVKSARVGYLPSIDGARISRCDLVAKFDDLVASAGTSQWLRNLEPWIACRPTQISVRKVKIPQPLLSILSSEAVSRLRALSDIGVSVGQGLRTGANAFFYCDVLEVGQDSTLVRPGIAFDQPVHVPNEALQPVVRRQSEATGGFVIDPRQLFGRVLILDSFSPPEACARDERRQAMPEGLRHLVLHAEKTKSGSRRNPRFIPELSAVRTNVTEHSNKNGRPARHWFMLPPLASRHRPDLFVARINNLHPRTMLNPGRKAVVDANFSTLWIQPMGSTLKPTAVLALMNSTWCIAAMELLGTVMGGGALKLEATHLRRLPIPVLSCEDCCQLDKLGHLLVDDRSVAQAIDRIDMIVACALVGCGEAASLLRDLRQISTASLEARRMR